MVSSQLRDGCSRYCADADDQLHAVIASSSAPSLSAAPGRPRSRRRWLKASIEVLALGIIGICAIMLRPQSLGGPVNYVVVHGNSMFPTYHDGYLVVTHERPLYSVGDVVAYRVPRGELGTGRLIIHRIVGGSAGSGFVMKGDHNPTADPWHPKSTDVAGSSWIVGPRVGSLLVFLRQPLAAARLATLLAP